MADSEAMTELIYNSHFKTECFGFTDEDLLAECATSQHILFMVIWRRTYGKGPLR